MAMKHIPVQADREPEAWESPAGPSPGLEPLNSITVSAFPPKASGDSEVLEQSLKELVRYYRHSSVGRRCLGIVHQMNTPLQVLSFQLDLLEQKTLKELDLLSSSPLAGAEPLLNLNHYRQEKFRQLRRELDRLQGFARSLVLQGTHEDAREQFPLDLNQIYRQELELYLANPFFKHQVTCQCHFQDGLPWLSGHYIDFSQSFRHLIDNALEAMAGTERRDLTVVTAARDRGGIMMRIGDTGVGIPPGDLPRIFDPFFTTKRTPEGDRAGLGLFMVRRLLAPYRAELRVDSAAGGTWVTVSLPAA